MKPIQKYIPLFTVWTGILAAFLYFVFIKHEIHCIQSWLFLLCILAGVIFDFFICDWKHFSDVRPNGIDDENRSLLSKIEYHYQCYDKMWKNLFRENFLLFSILFIHGIVVFVVVYIINHETIDWTTIISFLGLFIPYFFHKAYYFAIRIPEFKQSVYVYYLNKNEIQKNLDEVSQIGEKVSSMQTIPREFDGWLFLTKTIFTDIEAGIKRKEVIVPGIKQSWTYKQLMDIIFFQKNHSEETDNYYKTEWDNEIKQFSGNDKLVRTCWEVYIETGSSRSGIPIHIHRITNFEMSEFHEEKVKVNGLLIIKRTL